MSSCSHWLHILYKQRTKACARGGFPCGELEGQIEWWSGLAGVWALERAAGGHPGALSRLWGAVVYSP